MKIILIFFLILVFFTILPISYQQNDNGESSDPWTLDYEFFKDIILVAIPTTVAFLSSKYLMNRWQKNREKADIKKMIQNEINESLIHYVMLFINIERKIFESYTEVSKDTYYEDGRIKNLKHFFPEDPNEFPNKKFEKEIKNMYDELSKMDEKVERLRSSLDLYYSDPSAVEQLKKILDSLGSLRIEFKKLLIVKTVEELHKQHEKFWKLADPYRASVKKFKEKLVKSEISID